VNGGFTKQAAIVSGVPGNPPAAGGRAGGPPLGGLTAARVRADDARDMADRAAANDAPDARGDLPRGGGRPPSGGSPSAPPGDHRDRRPARGHVVIAWAAVRGKAATADEPLHVASAVVCVTRFDFRVDPEDPPLWKYWAGLPHLVWRPAASTANTDGRFYEMPTYHANQWGWSHDFLYRTPGERRRRHPRPLAGDAARRQRVPRRARRRLGRGAWPGPVAAVVAAALYALDPNFLAHGPLVKNDVAFALAWTAVAAAVWQAGRGLTGARMFAAALACGAAMLIKFSALLVPPLAGLLLLARALLPVRWEVRHRGPEGLPRRLGLALGVFVAFALVSFLVIWAGYGFRFSMTPGYHLPLAWNPLLGQAAALEAQARGADPSSDEAATPGPFASGIRALAKLRCFPEAYLYGLLFTYCSALSRRGYLLGELSDTGWWYYFPVAMGVKTPVATLAMFRGGRAGGGGLGGGVAAPPRLGVGRRGAGDVPVAAGGLDARLGRGLPARAAGAVPRRGDARQPQPRAPPRPAGLPVPLRRRRLFRRRCGPPLAGVCRRRRGRPRRRPGCRDGAGVPELHPLLQRVRPRRRNPATSARRLEPRTGDRT
jgi:hypothetical protein